MEQLELLKSIGFTDKFIEELISFDKKIPNVNFNSSLDESVRLEQNLDISIPIQIESNIFDINKNLNYTI